MSKQTAKQTAEEPPPKIEFANTDFHNLREAADAAKRTFDIRKRAGNAGPARSRKAGRAPDPHDISKADALTKVNEALVRVNQSPLRHTLPLDNAHLTSDAVRYIRNFQLTAMAMKQRGGLDSPDDWEDLKTKFDHMMGMLHISQGSEPGSKLDKLDHEALEKEAETVKRSRLERAEARKERKRRAKEKKDKEAKAAQEKAQEKSKDQVRRNNPAVRYYDDPVLDAAIGELSEEERVNKDSLKDYAYTGGA